MPTTPLGRLAAALVALAFAVILAACGGSDGPVADAYEIEVDVTDGTVDTAEDTVEVAVGGTVRVTVTSDVDDEVHVHGVDRTVDLSAGVPATLEFTVDEPGVFEVETHGSHLLLFQLIVR